MHAMFSFHKTVWGLGFLALAAALLVFAVSSAWRDPLKTPQVTVTARTILDRIESRYVVVTHTAYLNQQSTIRVDQGSTWSNLLWGQSIEAEGVIRLDVGVDLTGLTEADIAIDSLNRRVTVDVPPADIVGAAQFGDIEVKTTQGILKYVFANQPHDDHNRALSQLIADAKTALREDPSVFEAARASSLKILRLVVESLDYELVMNQSP
jgi:hypothetical protein